MRPGIHGIFVEWGDDTIDAGDKPTDAGNDTDKPTDADTEPTPCDNGTSRIPRSRIGHRHDRPRMRDLRTRYLLHPRQSRHLLPMDPMRTRHPRERPWHHHDRCHV